MELRFISLSMENYHNIKIAMILNWSILPAVYSNGKEKLMNCHPFALEICTEYRKLYKLIIMLWSNYPKYILIIQVGSLISWKDIKKFITVNKCYI